MERAQSGLGFRSLISVPGRPGPRGRMGGAEGERRLEIVREQARTTGAIAATREQAARQALTEQLRGGIRRLFGA